MTMNKNFVSLTTLLTWVVFSQMAYGMHRTKAGEADSDTPSAPTTLSSLESLAEPSFFPCEDLPDSLTQELEDRLSDDHDAPKDSPKDKSAVDDGLDKQDEEPKAPNTATSEGSLADNSKPSLSPNMLPIRCPNKLESLPKTIADKSKPFLSLIEPPSCSLSFFTEEFGEPIEEPLTPGVDLVPSLNKGWLKWPSYCLSDDHVSTRIRDFISGAIFIPDASKAQETADDGLDKQDAETKEQETATSETWLLRHRNSGYYHLKIYYLDLFWNIDIPITQKNQSAVDDGLDKQDEEPKAPNTGIRERLLTDHDKPIVKVFIDKDTGSVSAEILTPYHISCTSGFIPRTSGFTPRTSGTIPNIELKQKPNISKLDRPRFPQDDRPLKDRMTEHTEAMREYLNK